MVKLNSAARMRLQKFITIIAGANKKNDDRLYVCLSVCLSVCPSLAARLFGRRLASQFNIAIAPCVYRPTNCYLTLRAPLSFEQDERCQLACTKRAAQRKMTTKTDSGGG